MAALLSLPCSFKLQCNNGRQNIQQPGANKLLIDDGDGDEEGPTVVEALAHFPMCVSSNNGFAPASNNAADNFSSIYSWTEYVFLDIA